MSFYHPALLIERLDPDHCGAEIIADPDANWACPVVHEYATDIAVARQQIIRDLAGSRIEPPDAVRCFVDLPSLAVSIEHDVIRRFPRQRHLPFGDLLRLRFEHCDG